MIWTEFMKTVRDYRVAVHDYQYNRENLKARIKMRELGDVIDKALAEGVTLAAEPEPTTETVKFALDGKRGLLTEDDWLKPAPDDVIPDMDA